MDKEQIISEYFSNLAKKRKNPYTPFKDKDYAKKMAQKSVEARRKNREAKEAAASENKSES